MDRDTAVVRINDGLGFRASGNALEPKIILRLQEAQRDLEKGKTLPPFLLQESQTFTLLDGNHSVSLPTGFLRLDDSNLPNLEDPDTFLPQYLEYVRSYSEAVKRVVNIQHPGEPAQMFLTPRVFVIRKSTIDFITSADRDYVIRWNYYKADAILMSNIENLWLANAPEWLIGEAGYRIATDARDQSSQALFDDMRQRARAAVFADALADEDAGGPMIMGARN